jgi:cation-transporting ATPase 13A1
MEIHHPPSIQRAKVYKPASSRRVVLLAIVSVLYAVVGNFVYSTAGEPYRLAQAEFEALKAKHPKLWAPSTLASNTAAKAARSIGGTVSNRLSLFDDFEDDDQEADEDEVAMRQAKAKADAAAAAEVAEAEAAAAAAAAAKNSDEHDEDDFDMMDFEEAASMPPTFLPNAWVAAALFLLLTGHALFHLMCHWSVDFRAMALFAPVSTAADVQAGCSVLMEPHPHRGAKALAELVPDVRSPGQLFLLFQRQRYDYTRDGFVAAEAAEAGKSAQNKQDDGSDDDRPQQRRTKASVDPRNGGLTLTKCPVDLDVREYFATAGLSHARVLQQQAHYGLNSLAIAQPQFLDLFKEQLVSPIAMFQFFTSLLWLMDEYWQYCLFSIFNVVTFESVTVTQRLKTMKSLDGMSAKSVPVLAFRDNRWTTTTTNDLVPGDVIAICRTSMGAAPGQLGVTVANDTIPCDCLILRGSAVANEATLTGESVPQMKDAISADYSAARCPLDIDGVHRVHVLFSGTSLINAAPTKQGDGRGGGGGGGSRGGGGGDGVDSIPSPPNNGCLCYVLRTGFNSSQGELVQMIEFSTQRVSSSNRETFAALGLLLCFALVAAGYVLKKGLEKGEQTTHQLLLKCVIIVTSVVPQQLPMQMAVAVNTALMQLLKSGIFCTEPFRVPFAGQIQHCLFDKTGTLSTDKLIPIGVVNVDSGAGAGAGGVDDGGGGGGAKASRLTKTTAGAATQESRVVVKQLVDGRTLVHVPAASPAAAMVLAACHSLVQVGLGDVLPACCRVCRVFACEYVCVVCVCVCVCLLPVCPHAWRLRASPSVASAPAATIELHSPSVLPPHSLRSLARGAWSTLWSYCCAVRSTRWLAQARPGAAAALSLLVTPWSWRRCRASRGSTTPGVRRRVQRTSMQPR